MSLITNYVNQTNIENLDLSQDKPFKPEDFKHSEYELDEIAEAEVVNTSCVYFGETVYVTHKAYLGDEAWYKGELGYEPAAYDGVSVWFKEDEIEFA